VRGCRIERLPAPGRSRVLRKTHQRSGNTGGGKRGRRTEFLRPVCSDGRETGLNLERPAVRKMSRRRRCGRIDTQGFDAEKVFLTLSESAAAVLFIPGAIMRCGDPRKFPGDGENIMNNISMKTLTTFPHQAIDCPLSRGEILRPCGSLSLARNVLFFKNNTIKSSSPSYLLLRTLMPALIRVHLFRGQTAAL